MRRYGRHLGLTLTEVLIVVATMVLLSVLAVPAAKKIVASIESGAGARKVIAAALANARAIAAKEQRYAGVRFQQDLNGDQYMIFIIHDPAPAPTLIELTRDPAATGTGLANGFRAIEGKKPIKLPQTIGVLDLRLRKSPADPTDPASNDIRLAAQPDLLLDTVDELRDTTTFSVVFSPAGRLIIHNVRIRNRWGRTNDTSLDDVFNTMNQVAKGIGMFFQDDAPPLAPPGLGEEMSRNCFVVYDKKRLEAAPASARWTRYLQELDMVYVNPHTGELVND